LEGIGVAHCIIPDIPLGERLTYTMGEAAGLLGISVATAYEERARGRLQTIKLAGRRLVTREAMEAYIATARRDTGHSDTGPVAEPLTDNEHQSRRASLTLPTPPRQIDRGNRRTEKGRPPLTGTGLQLCSPRSRKNNQHDDI
jgi:excisionase family DNA binding protein